MHAYLPVFFLVCVFLCVLVCVRPRGLNYRVGVMARGHATLAPNMLPTHHAQTYCTKLPFSSIHILIIILQEQPKNSKENRRETKNLPDALCYKKGSGNTFLP
jgi:hypothetical protein